MSAYRPSSKVQELVDRFQLAFDQLPEKVQDQLAAHWDQCQPFAGLSGEDLHDWRDAKIRLGSQEDEQAFLDAHQQMLDLVEQATVRVDALRPADVILPSQKTLGMLQQLEARIAALPIDARDKLYSYWERTDALRKTKLSPESSYNPATGQFKLGNEADETILQAELNGMLEAVEEATELLPKQQAKVDSVGTWKPETMTLLKALAARMELVPAHTRIILEERWRKRDRSVHVQMGPDKMSMAMPQTQADEAELVEELTRQLNEVDDELIQIQYQRNPSHVVALEQQLLAHRVNSLMFDPARERKKTALQKATLHALKSATPYCWAPACVEAVATAASLLPGAARPSELPPACELMAPAASGWWWFERPLPLKTVTAGEPVVALCWRREVRTGPVEIIDALGDEVPLETLQGAVSLTWFCAFIHDTVTLFGRPTLAPNPTLAWVWVDTVPIDQHAVNVRARFTELTKKKLMGLEAAGDDDSTQAALWLSKFWLAGALWLNKRIIGRQGVSIPRQQGRKLARDHGLDKPPLVEVVYLRRNEPKPHDPLRPASEPKDHPYCWLVHPFPRRQWYPSKGRHELITVSEHIRGPRDRPLKNPVRVYAVNR